MPVLVSVLGQALLGTLTTIAVKLCSEKMIMSIILMIAEKAVKSTKTSMDDKVLEDLKKALEKND